jgi:hypothetical protein
MSEGDEEVLGDWRGSDMVLAPRAETISRLVVADAGETALFFGTVCGLSATSSTGFVATMRGGSLGRDVTAQREKRMIRKT